MECDGSPRISAFPGRIPRLDTLKASSLRRGRDRCRMRANWMRPRVGAPLSHDNSWAHCGCGWRRCASAWVGFEKLVWTVKEGLKCEMRSPKQWLLCWLYWCFRRSRWPKLPKLLGPGGAKFQRVTLPTEFRKCPIRRDPLLNRTFPELGLDRKTTSPSPRPP